MKLLSRTFQFVHRLLQLHCLKGGNCKR